MRELLHEVLPPELDRIHLELACKRVDGSLEHVRRLRSTGPSVRIGRCRIRENAGERHAVARDRVRPGIDPRAEKRDAWSDQLEVRAHRAPRLRLDRRDHPVLHRRERQLVDDVAAVDGRDVVLGALLRPLHGTAEPLREHDRERLFGVDVELRPEPAAHVRSDHADLRLGDSDYQLEREAEDVRHLRRRPESHLVGRADLGEHAARLDRVRDEPRLEVAARDDDIGGVDRRLDLVGLELPDVALVRAEVAVDERRTVVQRLRDVGVRRERFVTDLDELGRVLREGTTLSDDDRDAITLVASLVRCEWEVRRHLDVLGDGPCARKTAHPVAGEVRAGERRNHTLRGTRRVEVHSHDARSWIRAAHHDHVDGRRQCQVVDEGA